jgi:anaerobic selenocysteine-containing dehydrogenase
MELSRRDFLKVAGAGAAAVAVMEPLMAAPAAALTLDPTDVNNTTTYLTTCPYCSAQCGQRVVVGNDTKKVYDIYGDYESPTNNGGLCAKGAGSFQLVNNNRRLGVPEHTVDVDGKDFTGEAWKRVGDGAWSPITLATAMTEIAEGDGGGTNTGLKALRGAVRRT